MNIPTFKYLLHLLETHQSYADLRIALPEWFVSASEQRVCCRQDLPLLIPPKVCQRKAGSVAQSEHHTWCCGAVWCCAGGCE